jgi:hypothetical protein
MRQAKRGWRRLARLSKGELSYSTASNGAPRSIFKSFAHDGVIVDDHQADHIAPNDLSCRFWYAVASFELVPSLAIRLRTQRHSADNFRTHRVSAFANDVPACRTGSCPQPTWVTLVD